MKTSDNISNITPAFLKAQKEMEGAKKSESNPFFKSKYADLTSVLKACKGPLNNNGISILQPHTTEVNPVTGDETHYVETILIHESGEYFSSKTKLEVEKKNDPQKFGSSQSYARRYGLQSLISLPAEDDDAEGSMNIKNKTSYTKKEETTTAPVKKSQQRFRKKTDDKKEDHAI
jgi:hypothetical protein